MSFNFKQNEKSAWTFYPDKFKFYSVHFLLNNEVTQTERETYDMMAFLSDIGGTVEIIGLILGALVFPFQDLRVRALMTSRLFHLTKSRGEIANEMKRHASMRNINQKLDFRPTGEVEVNVPVYLDWQLV